MPTISNTPRPGYAYDSTDDVWYPIGTGPHTHGDYITSGSAINPTIVDAKGDIITATAADTPARLAVGTNGQLLSADSTAATGLAWTAAPSSGLTFISSTTFTNSTGVNIDNIFSTSYENYLVILDDLTSVGGGAYLAMQLRYGSSTQTTGYYTSNFGYSASDQLATLGRNNGSEYTLNRMYPGANGSAQFFISGVGNTSEIPTIRGQFSNTEGTDTGVFGGRTAAQTYTGLRFITSAYSGGGSNVSGRVTVYGLAKA